MQVCSVDWYPYFERGNTKSFVDDLAFGRGVVPSRAAFTLRSIETQPFDGEICPHSTGILPTSNFIFLYSRDANLYVLGSATRVRLRASEWWLPFFCQKILQLFYNESSAVSLTPSCSCPFGSKAFSQRITRSMSTSRAHLSHGPWKPVCESHVPPSTCHSFRSTTIAFPTFPPARFLSWIFKSLRRLRFLHIAEYNRRFETVHWRSSNGTTALPTE